MKSFGTWDTQDVHSTFGVLPVPMLPSLAAWLAATEELNLLEIAELESLREDLISLNENWNEDELKMHFIAPLMHLVHYGKKHTYNAFYQRSFSAVVGEYEIGGVVDMLVAKGWEKPSTPYFFLHEYKQEQGGKADARAQLLSAMLAAQALNPSENPIFGVYLVGASWRFTVLEGKSYAIKRFDATEEDDLLQVFNMLRWIKHYVERELSIV
ncbi:MAG: hypothetical protein ACKVTZ_03445 [Bacteroidia bacterium]